MVNEFNKPPKTVLEGDNLRERMEMSNRNMLRMRQEHEELLREMEALRQTAAELTPSNIQQTSAQNQALNQSSRTEVNEADEPSTSEATSHNNNEINTETIEASSSTTINSEAAKNTNESLCTSGSSDDEEESAQFIREKIAQIAAMKTQFQRVQHTINTTNLIEAHLARSSLEQTPSTTEQVQPTNTNNTLNALTTAEEDTEDSPINVEQSIGDLNLNLNDSMGTSREENMELLMNMLNLFDEFKNDLREQANGLRAERDRLRALKESMLRRRNQS